MSKLSSLLHAALLVVLLACTAAQARDKIVLASIVSKDSYADRLLQLIYADAFGQLQLDVVLRYYPAARAVVESKNGNVDGEASRSYEYGALQPDLLRIDAPVLVVTTSAFTRDPKIRVQGWESLRGTGYRVEYRAGYARAVRLLIDVVPPILLSSVVDSRLGLKKLAIGRTDLYVDIDETVLPLLATEPFKSAGIYKAGVIDSFPVYCYLSHRHAALAPKLAQILKKMKADGVLDRYRVKANEVRVP